MDRIYEISFHIYRIILIAISPIFFFGKFMVGIAGHNSEIKIIDYLLLVFAILTSSLLTILNKTCNTKNSFRNLLRFTIVVLVSIGIGFLFYGLYDTWLLYRNQNFGIGDNILVAIIILLMTLSSLLLVGLIKNKI